MGITISWTGDFRCTAQIGQSRSNTYENYDKKLHVPLYLPSCNTFRLLKNHQKQMPSVEKAQLFVEEEDLHDQMMRILISIVDDGGPCVVFHVDGVW